LARIAESKFEEAFADFQMNCPALKKLNEVNYKSKDPNKADTNYWYTDLDAIIEAVKVPLARAGLTRKFQTWEENKKIFVKCIVSHWGGHKVEDTMSDDPDESGGKKGLHAKSSTVTYLRRYTLSNCLGISGGARDDDGRRAVRAAEDGIDEQARGVKILPKPTNSQFNEALRKLKTGETTLSELESAYTLSENQLEAAHTAANSTNF
jgi:hypothetical protein